MTSRTFRLAAVASAIAVTCAAAQAAPIGFMGGPVHAAARTPR